MTSWLIIRKDSDFSIHNFPFGIFSSKGEKDWRIGSAIGDYVIDLQKVQDLGFFQDLALHKAIFDECTLNPFIALGKKTTNGVRERLQQMFSEANYNDAKSVSSQFLIKMTDVQLHLPVAIGDYTDFYSSKEHATNVGIMFRDPANALLPNWLHIPVGYHGRASSVVVDGTPIYRPKGQILPPEGGDTPIFSQSKRIDFELEMGFIIGKPTALGDSISTEAAEDFIFGMVLLNDWSARDIQQWEYVPLGPFLGKNFGTTISPWVVTLEALDFARTKSPEKEKKVLAYLENDGQKSYDIQLNVAIQPENSEEYILSKSNFKYMYWTMDQQLAHHTINGCNVQIGDLMGSGTISGATPDSYGSMLEIAWKGTKPVPMPDGSERRFIHDNDTVILRGWAEKDGVRVGFGEAKGKLLATK